VDPGAEPAVVVPPPEAPAPESAPPIAEATVDPVWKFLRERHDADRDGRILPAEYRRSPDAFGRLDIDGDGAVSAADFGPQWSSRPFPKGFVYGVGGPEVGDPAPDFHLRATSGETLALSSFRGKKPVALVFGSFT